MKVIHHNSEGKPTAGEIGLTRGHCSVTRGQSDSLPSGEIKHRESEMYEHFLNAPQDAIDTAIEQIKLGITPSRWTVIGNVQRIIKKLQEKGIYQPHHDDMLWDLADSAKESL